MTDTPIPPFFDSTAVHDYLDLSLTQTPAVPWTLPQPRPLVIGYYTGTPGTLTVQFQFHDDLGLVEARQSLIEPQAPIHYNTRRLPPEAIEWMNATLHQIRYSLSEASTWIIAWPQVRNTILDLANRH